MKKPERGAANPESGFSVERLSRWEQVDEIRPALEHILQSSTPEVGAFSTHEFLRAWWEAYGSERELFFLTCRNSGGEIVGLAPLFRESELRRRVLRLVGDTSDDVDGFDFLVMRGFELQAVAAWCEWLTSNQNEWSGIELNSVPTESRLLAAFRIACKSKEIASREVKISNQLIRLSVVWEEYLRGLSKKMRSSISHQMRIAEQSWHPSMRLCQSESEALEWLALLAKWQEIRWTSRGKTGKLAWERRRMFYERFIIGLLHREDLMFCALIADDQVLAVELGCRFRGRYIGILPAFDPSFASFSPGVVLQALIIQALISNGMDCYDFGAGDEEYKKRWANERKTFSNLHCAPRWSSEGLQLLLGNARDWARERLKRALPARGYAILAASYRALKGQKK